MFILGNNEEAIKTLQKMMGLPISGSVDERTESELALLKKEYGLPSSEGISYRLFQIIKERYHMKKTADYVKNSNPHFDDLPYEEGDVGERIRAVNSLISSVLSRYRYHDAPPFGLFYGNDTAKAVSFLRKVYRLDESFVIDNEFIYMLLSDNRKYEY